MNEVKIWSPATIANLNVGFDGLGCALTQPGEETWMKLTREKGVVRIVEIHGASFDTRQNVAAVAAESLLKALGAPVGIDMVLHKQIKPGSGIGSSASSAAAAVVGVNELLQAGLRWDELLPFALDGEFIASGARHADNVAPALAGGLVLCPPEGAPMKIPVPEGLHLVVLHPQVQVQTKMARTVLPSDVPFQAAVDQSRWMGTFIAACFGNQAERAVFAMEDLLVSSHRQHLIPKFEEVKKAAMSKGARAGGISGSGPSTFWVCREEGTSAEVEAAVSEVMREASIDHFTYRTSISSVGAHRIS